MDATRPGRCFGVLVFWLGAFIALGYLLAPLPCEARKIYRDQNGFFKFYPPPGWLQKGSSEGQKSTVAYTSPDGKVSLRVSVWPARPSEKIWEKLLAGKKMLKKAYEEKFPEAKVTLRETVLGGIKCIKIITEIPGSHVQANFVFVKNGLHFNLSYAGRRQQDLDRHKPAALAAFRTIQPGK